MPAPARYCILCAHFQHGVMLDRVEAEREAVRRARHRKRKGHITTASKAPVNSPSGKEDQCAT